MARTPKSPHSPLARKRVLLNDKVVLVRRVFTDVDGREWLDLNIDGRKATILGDWIVSAEVIV